MKSTPQKQNNYDIQTIFISATSIDLSGYVKTIKTKLEQAGYTVTTMTDFGAQPEDAVTVSLAELEATDAVVGVYARRYGYIPVGQEQSVTEQEFHHARSLGKPFFAFVVDEANTDLQPGPGEDDNSPEAQAKQDKLKAFIVEISTALVREQFVSDNDLAIKVLASLSRYKKRFKTLQPPVNAFRLVLEEEQIRCFHNDQCLASQPAALDSALHRTLEQYNEAKRQRTAGVPTKSPNPGVSPAEIMTGHMGIALSEQLLPPSIAEKLDQLIQTSTGNAKGFQVTIQSENPAWTGYPLETLRIPQQTQPLALQPGIDFVRLAGHQDFDAFPNIPGPLKILMAIASPIEGEHSTLLDYEKELGKVMDIVETIPNFSKPERKPIVHILDQGTLKAICEAFSRNQYHVLHISTHGEPGHIILENEEGASRRVSAQEFVQLFPSKRKPVLTTLSACHSGVTGEMDSFAGELIQHGFSYVIAMQEAVSDPYATEFVEILYRKLAYDDEPVIDNAFSQTRIELEAKRLRDNQQRSPEQQMPPEWMVPALYKGNLYQYMAYETNLIYFEREMATPEEDFQTDLSHRKIGEFVGRRRQLLTMRRDVLNKQGGCALITGMGGVGKSTLVARSLADAIRANQTFEIHSVTGSISLVDLLQRFGCAGDTLELLWHGFFSSKLPEKGRHSIFLFDNFEENLITAENDSVPPIGQDHELPELSDSTLSSFLAELIYSGKTRILITSRYPFRLLKNQHRNFTHLQLGALSLAETRKLMERLQGLQSLTLQERLQVLQTLGGHPRTLEFLDAILRDGTFTYADVQKRLSYRLDEQELDAIQKQENLSADIQASVTLAARDCFVDQLLTRLSAEEAQLLYNFSVFQGPRPQSAFTWLAQKEKLSVAIEPTLNRLIRLSLLHQEGKHYTVHRWTADYFRQVMGDERWKQANIMAGEYLCEPKQISLDDAIEAWRHFLAAGDMERADEVAIPLENQLNVWGDWEMSKIVCRTMLEATENELEKQARWLHTYGNLFYQQGNYEEAKEFYKKSFDIFEQLGDLSGTAGSYHSIGMIQQDQGDYEGARELYKKSLDIFEQLRDVKRMASSYHQMGVIQQDQGNYEGAREFHKKSFDIFEQLGNLSGMAKSYHQMGMIQQAQGDYEGARELYKKSLDIKEQLGDLSGMANSYHQMGMIQKDQGDYEGARELYKKSLDINEQLGDLNGMAQTYHSIGAIQQDQGDYEGARELYKKSLDLAEKLGSLKGMASNYHQMGWLQQDQGDYEGARELYKKSLDINEQLGDLSGMASNYHQMGWLQQDQGDYEGARELYKKSFDIKEQLGDLSGMAQSYHNIGAIQQAQEDYEGARELYKKSLDIKEQLGDLNGMAISFGQMGNLAFQQEEDETAFVLFVRAFLIFAQLQAPYVEQALDDMCQVATQQPGSWEGWLTTVIDDASTRSHVAGLIRQQLEAPDEPEQAEAMLAQMKKVYEQLGEAGFIQFFKEQTGQDVPAEVLELLRNS